MILQVDPTSAVPPYEQVRSQVTAMAESGVLPPGTRLPPIRQLAGDLGLAGGTVARAYRELEQDGVVVARGRHGTIIAPRPTAPDPRQSEARVRAAAEAFAATAHHAGADIDSAVAAVHAAFTHLGSSGAPTTRGAHR